jgi:hypothetical protein
VIVKVSVAPVQEALPFVKVGVTVIVATTGSFPILVAVKIGRLPEPVAGSPMPVAEFVHVYVVVPPRFPEVKLTAAVEEPLHTT